MMNRISLGAPIIFGYCILLSVAVADNDTHVLEVSLGDTAVLNCMSNDDDHRFQFWLINTKEVIGPGNVIDRRKYKYEVLSGELLIKDVSLKEHGLYTCFCRHLTNMTYNVKSIELIVKRDWEEVYDNDYTTNVFRILLLVGMVLLLGVLFFILFTLRSDRSSFLKEFGDEESLDEEINKPSASYERMIPSTNYNRKASDSGANFDNISLDREFPKEFQATALMADV